MKSSEIYIYGGGGHGQVVADIARANGYETIHFLDDSSENKFSEDLPKGDIIVAIGNMQVRRRLCKRVKAAGFNLVSLIHPSAIISSSAIIGAGVVVMPLAVINARVRIDEGCIINTAAVVEHDCVVNAYANICPRVALAGNVTVGEQTDIGIGSCSIQGLKIGSFSIVGAGSVIVNHIEDGVVAFGSPARTQRLLRDVA